MKSFLKDSYLPLFLLLLMIPIGGLLVYIANTNPLSTEEEPIVTEVKSITDDSFAIAQQSLTEESDETSDVVIIDLREQDEYVAGHLDNTLNLPYSIILHGTFDLPKESRVILYSGINQVIDHDLLVTKLSEKQIQIIEFLETPFGDVQEAHNLKLAVGTPRGEEPLDGSDEILADDNDTQTHENDTQEHTHENEANTE